MVVMACCRPGRPPSRPICPFCGIRAVRWDAWFWGGGTPLYPIYRVGCRFPDPDRGPRVGCVGHHPRLPGPVCHNPQTTKAALRGLWATTPVFRGLWATTPK